MTDVLEKRSTGRRDLAFTERGEAGAPLYDTLAALLRHPRVMVLVTAFCFSLAVLAAFLRADFTATSRLTPQASESNLAQFSGVAAQLGVAMPTTPRQNESVDFYADLLKSRELLDSLAVTRFRFAAAPGDTLEGTYMDIYQLTGRTEFDRLFKARRRLEGKISVSVKRQSALVTLQVKAKWGTLAEQMNRRLLNLVNSFNLQRRQTQAHAEREFLDQRLQVVGDDLRDVQATQRGFLERNRSWENDPALALQMQNLTRRVTEVQQTQATLLQRYEQARVDEVRNTPVITIVESPEGSRRRSRGLILAGLLGIATGGILSTALALLLDQASKERTQYPETYDAVRGLWRALPRRLLGSGSGKS